ncbi:MAG: TonB-dependent receptor, partial [Armatimonadetes bacterium]|nr:TonB-dependent receptor [Armatimonadota bacterium]
PGAVVAMNFGRDWARSWGTEARYSWKVSPRMSAIFGTEYLRTFKARRLNYDCEPYYYLYYDRTSSFHQSSYYVQTDYKVNRKVTLVAGSRWDNSSIYDKNRTSRFALVYNQSPTTSYKFLYGEAFRSPSISEAMRSKNPSALRPEKIRTHEFVWDQQIGKTGRLITNFYSYHMFDMIRKYKNIGVIDSRGIESQYDFHLKNGSSGYIGLAYMDAKSGNADYILPSSPKWVITGGACGSLLRGKLDLAAEVQYVGDRHTAQGLRLDGYTIANLTLTSDSIINGLTISLAIRNLFNATAYASPRPQNRITTVLDRIPQPERSVCLELIYGI